MKNKTLLAVFTFSLLTFACNQSNKNDKIIDVDKEFTFQLWEQLDENGGNFQLIPSTFQNQKCSMGIDYNQNNVNSRITVTLKSLVQKTSVCDGKIVPATDTISLGNLPKGIYKLNINLKDVVLNDGSLAVDDKKYTIAMSKEDGIDIPYKEILRVPKGAVWGYVSYDAGQEAKLAKFNDNLNRIATPLSISAGDYGYFNMKSSTIEVKSNFDTKKANTRQILYNLTGTRSELQILVQDYKNQGLDIKIQTFDGKVFN